jgi:hypothetical protein
VAGEGAEAGLYRAVWGNTKRQHARTWEGFGETIEIRID